VCGHATLQQNNCCKERTPERQEDDPRPANVEITCEILSADEFLGFEDLILEGGVVVDIGAHIDWDTRSYDGKSCKENILS
jgi:hypothetical protein